MQDTIEKLYQEILKDNSKNTFLKNIDLFKEFYEDRNIIYWDFNEKVQTIVKYFLKYEEGEIFEYFYYNIISQLDEYFGKIHLKAMYKDEEINSFENVLKAINLYEEIKEILSQNKYAHKSNSMNCSSTNKFCDDTIIRDLTISLITQLSYNFLSVPNEKVLDTIEMIQNNPYIDKMTKKDNYSLMDKEFIYKYVNDYVNVVEFCTNNDMKNDKLINFFLKNKNSKPNDKQLIKKIIKQINKEQLKKLYGNENLLDGLYDSLKEMNFSKDEINMIINENMEEFINDYSTDLLNIIRSDKYTYYNHILLKKIIKRCMTKPYDFYGDEKLVKYLLENNIFDNLQDGDFLYTLFMFNLKEFNDVTKKYENIDSNNIPPLEDEKVETLLKQHMSKEKKINFEEAIGIIKSIIEKESMYKNIPVFLFMDDRLGGSYNLVKKCITLNYESILNFIKNPEDVEIINTIYHELRHENQLYEYEQNGKKDFKKELLIDLEHFKFYTENYKNISYEQDARKAAFYKLLIFLQQYKTNEEINLIIDNLDNYLKEFDLPDKKTIFNTKDMSTDEIYEKLIFFKPEIEKNTNLFTK